MLDVSIQSDENIKTEYLFIFNFYGSVLLSWKKMISVNDHYFTMLSQYDACAIL
jgi:hypothetical protein